MITEWNAVLRPGGAAELSVTPQIYSFDQRVVSHPHTSGTQWQRLAYDSNDLLVLSF